jgi:hypothetical protein
MKKTDEELRPSLAELTEVQAESTDPAYLAWVERRIAEGRQQLKDPTKRISADEIWQALGLDR